MLRDAIAVRSRIATEPGDTLEQVRAKERALDRAAPRRRAGRALEGRVRRCGAGRGSGESPAAASAVPFGALADEILGRGALARTRRGAAPRRKRGRSRRASASFTGRSSFPRSSTTPPASRCRRPASTRSSAIRPGRCCAAIAATSARGTSARTAAARLTDFARGSGIYTAQGDGHVNLYQLFLERSARPAAPRRPARHGPAVGARHRPREPRRCGGAPARSHAGRQPDLAREPRRDVSGPSQPEVSSDLGHCRRAAPPRFPAVSAFAVRRSWTDCRRSDLTRRRSCSPGALLERLSGEQTSPCPTCDRARDVDILHAIAFTHARARRSAGWHVHFGRELNATDDRRHFTRGGDGLPVVEGKHLASVQSSTSPAARLRIAPEVGRDLLDPARTFGATAARLPGGRIGDQPADAHRRHRARGHGHDAHGLLPQGPRWTTRRSGTCAACSTASSRTTSSGSASARTSPPASSIGCPCRCPAATNRASAKSPSSAAALARGTAAIAAHYAAAPGAGGARVRPSTRPSFTTFSIDVSARAATSRDAALSAFYDIVS